MCIYRGSICLGMAALTVSVCFHGLERSQEEEERREVGKQVERGGTRPG